MGNLGCHMEVADGDMVDLDELWWDQMKMLNCKHFLTSFFAILSEYNVNKLFTNLNFIDVMENDF